ncbi:MAG: hypothetical protein R6X15_06805 [Pseudomonadota bacterium]
MPFGNSAESGYGGDSATFAPEGELSLYANAEYTFADDRALALDYDSYRFAKSDEQKGVYQPECAQETLGLTWHYRF